MVKRLLQERVMRIDETCTATKKCDVHLLALILSIKGQAALQLDFEEDIAADMASDEIRALPVVAEPQAV